MYLIPPSNLIHAHILAIIDNQFHSLNADTLTHIKAFLCPMIHIREKHYFWYRLAKETHNMDQWGNYVIDIIEKRYGLFHVMTKHITKLRKEFRDPLDYVLCVYYDQKGRTIHNGYFIPERAFYGRNKPGGISHTMIQYNPFLVQSDLTSAIPIDEMGFVNEYLKRYKSYVDFVETFYKHYKYRIPLYSIVELGNMIEDVNNILPKLRL